MFEFFFGKKGVLMPRDGRVTDQDNNGSRRDALVAIGCVLGASVSLISYICIAKSAVEAEQKALSASAIAFSPARLEVGPVSSGMVIKRSFLIRNVSDTRIKILWIESGCSCSVVSDYRGRVLRPGEYMRVGLEWRARDSPNKYRYAIFVGYKILQQARSTPLNIEVLPVTATVLPARSGRSNAATRSEAPGHETRGQSLPIP